MSQLKEGILIAIEGIDGAGKTTQCKFLRDWLNSQGLNSAVIKEPTDGKYGKQIRIRSKHQRLFDSAESELDLFIKDRKENVTERIKPRLKDNKIVIMDRYYFSTIAYQSVLGIDSKYIKKINEEFAPIPDLTIIIDVMPDVGIKRIGIRGDECDSFEKEDYLVEVRNAFLKMMEYPNVSIVDGNSFRSSQQVFKDIQKIVEPVIKKKLKVEGEILVC